MFDSAPDLTTEVAPAWTRQPLYEPWLTDHECELERCWRRSSLTLRELERVLSMAPLPASIETILVTGSLARMEQQHGSDCDVIVVVASDCDSSAANDAWQAVWRQIEAVGLMRPQNSGIYSVAGRWDRFSCRNSRGQVDESQVDFGHRMQLMLESQPVYQLQRFRELSRATAERFLVPFQSPRSLETAEQFQYLAREACRYYQSLRIRSHWISDPRRHQLINYKLRFTRLLAYAGLLALLGIAATAKQTAVDALCAGLLLTPLERLGCALSGAATRHRTSERAPAAETMARCKELLECVEVLLTNLNELRVRVQSDAVETLAEMPSTARLALDRLTEILRDSFVSASGDWGQIAINSLLF